MKTAILFDLDDTLYPERDYLHSGWKAVAADVERHGLLSADEAYNLMTQARNAFDALHGECPDFPVKKMVEIYRNHKPNIHLATEVKNLLISLHTTGVPTGIITDGRIAGQRNKIEALGLGKLVDYISISEEIGADKHSEKPFDLAMKHFNSQQYIYVGDNPAKDFKQPNRLGWHTLMLQAPMPNNNIHPQTLYNATPDTLPDIVVSNIEELKLVLSKICSGG